MAAEPDVAGRAPGRSQPGPHPLGGSADVRVGRGPHSRRASRCRRRRLHGGVRRPHRPGAAGGGERAGHRHRARTCRRPAAGLDRDDADLPLADGLLRPAAHRARHTDRGAAAAVHGRRAGGAGARPAVAAAGLLRRRGRARPGRHRAAPSAPASTRSIALHSGTEVRVYMLGFLPGFPFMGDLPEQLACRAAPNRACVCRPAAWPSPMA